MKHELLKLTFYAFLIGVSSGESSTSTAPVLDDELPWTFKVVTSTTDAPATTPPPVVTAKPAQTLNLVTGGTNCPAASPNSTAMGTGRSGSVRSPLQL
ncbi:hypothetical protein V7S43_013587 [Phytophthora oleae]|uniref:Uncharacterized protein n=1 Tax=Phytophthora oleae TaxID=2107226 RepID=A0ABD3F8J9_9STRA